MVCFLSYQPSCLTELIFCTDSSVREAFKEECKEDFIELGAGKIVRLNDYCFKKHIFFRCISASKFFAVLVKQRKKAPLAFLQ